MNEVRRSFLNRVLDHRVQWADLLSVTYALVQKDRIGDTWACERGGVPGIWGHSYVRTYNRWTRQAPRDITRMEGGIGTTYYVVHALSQLHAHGTSSISSSVSSDLIQFFRSRQSSDGGFGIRTIGSRGEEKIEAHLRHTCYGLLILLDLDRTLGIPQAHDMMRRASEYVLSPRLVESLIDSWFGESWPVGGMAAYVAVRDRLLESANLVGDDIGRRALQVWPGVKRELLEVLVSLTSEQVYSAISKTPQSARGREFTPFWHPIKNFEILKVHSTLGCLGLIGTDIAATPKGRDRISAIAAAIRSQVEICDSISFEMNGQPSIAAAMAMLEFFLGPWCDPMQDDASTIEKLAEFIESNWREEGSYGDYWSEFTAPILALSEFRESLNMREIVARGNLMVSGVEASPLRAVFDSVKETALTTGPTVVNE